MGHSSKLRKGVSKDEEIISRYLGEGEVIHLALSDKLGLFSVPVNYGYCDGKIYVHSSKQGRKIDALRGGGVIGFSVIVEHKIFENSDPCQWGCSFKSVIGTGVPRILDSIEKKSALNKIMKQYSGNEWTFKDSAVEAVDVVEIMITSVSARTVVKE